jgi:hypothetical protein
MEKLYCGIRNYIHAYILCFPLNQNLGRVIIGCGVSNTVIHNKTQKYSIYPAVYYKYFAYRIYMLQKKNSLRTVYN